MNVSMNSMIANTLFGSKSSISAGSFLSASNFGDLSLMRSGVYTKMLKSYYAKQTSSTDKTNSSGKNSSSKDYLNTINDKISKLKTSTSDEALSNIKSEADQMKKAADAVTAIDYDKTSGDAVYSKVKDLVNTYNSLAKQTGKSDLVSISQSRTWMVNDTTSDIKNFLSGASGYASRLSTKANGFYQLASNQLTLNSGTSLYNKYGLLG